MNRFLIFQNEKLSANTYKIFDPERLKHLKAVLKAKVGDTLKVSLIGEGIGKAYIKELAPKSLTLSLEQMEPLNHAPYDLIVAVSRPPTLKKILEHATTLGVGRFDFFKADLSEKSYLDAKLFKEQNYLKHLKYGISQGAIYHHLPEIELHKNILNDWKKREQKFILSPQSTTSFLTQKLDFKKRITLAIGPERGWTKDELAKFKDLGFISIGISPAILRVETATFSSLGQLELLRNVWKYQE